MTYELSQALLSHVHDQEVATSALLRDYAANGAQLIKEVGAAHEIESVAANVKLDKIMQNAAAQREQHARACGKIVEEITNSKKQPELAVRAATTRHNEKMKDLQSLRERFCMPRMAVVAGDV